MTSIQLAEFVLWKSIKQKREDGYANQQSRIPLLKTEEIVFPNEMICRVCTSAADIPVSDKINGISISTAIRTVSCVWVSNTDSYPKYVCKNCLEELKVALSFKKKCEAAASLFHQTQAEKSDNTSQMVKHDFAVIINKMKERRLDRLAIKSEKRTGTKRKENSIQGFQETYTKKKDSSIKTVKCKQCDLTFESKGLLIAHRLQQNCVCPPCPICGKLVSNLARHKKIVHLRLEKYACHICGKITYSSGGLRNHLTVHSDQSNFPCPLCPYKGKRQAYLTLHMRVHTGERRYLCSKCPAKFVNPSNLRKHQLTHSSKKFECNKCKKKFRMMKSLEEHYEAAHLNVRYRCSICSRDLWTRRKLLSHELRVHKREKHKLYDEVHKVVLNEDVILTYPY